MGNVIEFEGVRKYLGDRLVLKSVSFQIKEGEIFGLIGLSGSGKTTVLHHLIGFLQPSAGKIRFSKLIRDHNTGKVMSRLVDASLHPYELKSSFGFAPQKPSFYPQLSVMENLLHFGSLYNLDRSVLQKNSDILLSLTKLTNHKNVLAEHLSGGQQRRLSIMCGLIHNPDVLILDEPTADLDPILREEFWAMIRQLNKQGKTIVVASHFLEELEKVCDSIAIIHQGEIIKCGPIEQVISKQSEHEEVIIRSPARFHEEIVRELSQNGSDLKNLHYTNSEIIFQTSNAYEVMVAVALMIRKDHERIMDVQIRQPGLNELFSRLLA